MFFRRKRKAMITSPLADLLAMILFVLVVVIFMFLMKVTKTGAENRLEASAVVSKAELSLITYLRTRADGGATFSELIMHCAKEDEEKCSEVQKKTDALFKESGFYWKLEILKKDSPAGEYKKIRTMTPEEAMPKKEAEPVYSEAQIPVVKSRVGGKDEYAVVAKMSWVEAKE